jgi:hypothetical protein
MKLTPNNPDKYESATDSEMEADPEPEMNYFDTDE